MRYWECCICPSGCGMAHVGCMSCVLERSAEKLQCVGVPQVRCAHILHADVVHVLRRTEERMELHRPRYPSVTSFAICSRTDAVLFASGRQARWRYSP